MTFNRCACSQRTRLYNLCYITMNPMDAVSLFQTKLMSNIPLDPLQKSLPPAVRVHVYSALEALIKSYFRLIRAQPCDKNTDIRR